MTQIVLNCGNKKKNTKTYNNKQNHLEKLFTKLLLSELLF